MTPHVPLVISANTLRPASFHERLVAAAEAGYAGIGLRLSDYIAARDSGLDDDTIVGAIADAGLSVVELETAWDWVEDNVSETSTSDTQRELFRVADMLNCRQLNLPSFFAHTLTDIVSSFGRLCDRAAQQNLRIGLEFLPYGQISHLTFAWQVVSDADRENGGVLVDTWHYFRSGSQHGQLATIPVEKILSIQLNDVADTPAVDLTMESRHHRLLPGTGSGDLTGLLKTLKNMRYTGPMSVEVFSDALDALPAHRVARDSMRAARKVLDAAGWSVMSPAS